MLSFLEDIYYKEFQNLFKISEFLSCKSNLEEFKTLWFYCEICHYFTLNTANFHHRRVSLIGQDTFRALSPSPSPLTRDHGFIIIITIGKIFVIGVSCMWALVFRNRASCYPMYAWMNVLVRFSFVICNFITLVSLVILKFWLRQIVNLVSKL